MSASGIVALLSDFGLADGYVGVMKGVILGIAPGTQLVDLTHDVSPQDVSHGAWILSTAWRSFPAETIFLAVVDPGVGTARHPVVLSAGGRTFVGPDNGLFSLVLDAAPAQHAVILDDPAYYTTARPSATFHGRDIFAPCAAHLAAGVPLEALGSPLAPEALVRLPTRELSWEGGMLVAHVLHIDRFGNVITDIGPSRTDRLLAEPQATVSIGTRTISERSATFGDGPDQRPFLLRDSSGYLAIAVRNGSAASTLGIGRGAEIVVTGLHPLP